MKNISGEIKTQGIMDSNTVRIPKRYVLDLDEIMKSDNINKKLNTILQIFKMMEISIDENVLKDEFREYFKEAK